MQAWEEFLASQENELGKETVNKWLSPLKILQFDACNLYLEAKDSFQVLWFEEHVRPKLEKTFVNNNGKQIKVHLKVASRMSDKQVKGRLKKGDATSAESTFQLTFDSLDPNATFDDFVVSDNHLLAYRLLSNLTKSVGADATEDSLLGQFNPIFIHGKPGSGKTHLLMATGLAFRERGLKVAYARADTFTEHLVAAIRASQMHKFRELYRSADILMIDDVHLISGKAATQEEFFHTFNALHVSGKQIILASSLAPQELESVEARLVSRFEWGIVLPLGPLNREELKLLVQKRGENLGCPLNQKVIEFLIDSFSSGIKPLVKAVEALVLRSHLNCKVTSSTTASITVAMAKQLLQDLIDEEEADSLTAEKVIQTVAEHFGIRQDDILSKSQSKECVLPRQIAMYFCRSLLELPFTKIGKFFSRDHSTVMSSVRLIKKSVEENDLGLIQVIKTLSKKLNP
ncbi:MAG: Chromosomal replication initiator protein DnaA [Chlamydiales bacterium]|jgi:chromosomal replication initiator protein|nr:Chromosomal replication initiator protein DnaA [Chlamydiales bacterium]